MNPLNFDEIRQYVNENIDEFHARRIQSLKHLKLERLLAKNPYLLKAKSVMTADEVVTNALEAFLSSSEEKHFGSFLEELAIFIAQRTCNGHKSTAPGIDLELFKGDVHYVISVKSGINWGNSSQQRQLEQNLRDAVVRVQQSRRGSNVRPVLGICYGKTKTSYVRGYLKVVGQNFWYLISENRNLYAEIVEPIGYRSEEHNQAFFIERSQTIDRLTTSFRSRFCDEATGSIDWIRLVQFNSGNYDLDNFLP